MDYTNTTKVEFIVDPKVLFHGWLIYSYLQIFKLIKCQLLPGECADWFFDNIMTWSYCLHRRYSMSWQKNSILTNDHALNREPVPLRISSENKGNKPKEKNDKKKNKKKIVCNVREYAWLLRDSNSLPGGLAPYVHPWPLRHAATEYCCS